MATYIGKHSWQLSWFDRHSDEFVGSATAPSATDEAIRAAFGFSVKDSLVGELPVMPETADAVGRLFGVVLQPDRYAYFVGAVADAS